VILKGSHRNPAARRSTVVLYCLRGALSGVRTIRSAGENVATEDLGAGSSTLWELAAFREGMCVEPLDLKTAPFFLAFIPQFVSPASGRVALQFMPLGIVAVALNTAVDIVVACRYRLRGHGKTAQVVTLSPRTPARMSPTQNNLPQAAESPNSKIPRITVPIAPIPVQTA